MVSQNVEFFCSFGLGSPLTLIVSQASYDRPSSYGLGTRYGHWPLKTHSKASTCPAVWFVALSVKWGQLLVVISCQEFELFNFVGYQPQLVLLLHCRVIENSVQSDPLLRVDHKFTNQSERLVNIYWPISHKLMKSCHISLVHTMGRDFLNDDTVPPDINMDMLFT